MSFNQAIGYLQGKQASNLIPSKSYGFANVIQIDI